MTFRYKFITVNFFLIIGIYGDIWRKVSEDLVKKWVLKTSPQKWRSVRRTSRRHSFPLPVVDVAYGEQRQTQFFLGDCRDVPNFWEKSDRNIRPMLTWHSHSPSSILRSTLLMVRLQSPFTMATLYLPGNRPTGWGINLSGTKKEIFIRSPVRRHKMYKDPL